MRRSLPAYDGHPNPVVWVQAGAGPIFRGATRDGEEYTCHHCGNILAEWMRIAQCFNIVFQCGRCGKRSMTPMPAPGTAFPRAYLHFESRNYQARTIATIDNVTLFGNLAFAQRERETGAHYVEPAYRQIITIESARQLVRDAYDLFGERLDGVLARHRRGTKLTTPPRNPHRLAELITALELPGLMALAVAFGELKFVLSAFERFRADPIFEELLCAAEDPANYWHALWLTVIASRWMEKAGVGFERANVGPGRVADLSLVVHGADHGSIEVKTPVALRRRLSSGDEERVISKALKKVGTNGGQLRSAGVLAFCGVGLRLDELDRLAFAAGERLRRSESGRPMIMAISLHTVHVHSLPSLIHHDGRPLVHTDMGERIVRNPAYSGPLTLELSEG